MKTGAIIGREYETELIRKYCDSPKAELIAIYGRRRVGKTYLIKQYFDNQFDFYFTGSFETAKNIQLRLFKQELERYSNQKRTRPKDWFEAFEQLREYLSAIDKDRLIVFLDELPWLDTPKSNFLAAFSYFWNSWGANTPKLKLFVCGSATTWMISRLIGDKGGMHGRVNRQIYLRPFTLNETEKFLQSKGIEWTHYQVAEIYMTMGGIPYYLDMLDASLSPNQNIDYLFFHDGAPLRMEYDFIFRSLFKDSTSYRSVVEALSKRSAGMTRGEIQEHLKMKSGGQLTEILDNLCKCDFLRVYSSFGKKQREQMFQLVDLFSLFHLRFVAKSSGQDEQYWSNMLDNPSRRSWQGYAFEQLCLHHLPQVKQALGISGILTEAYAWACKPFTDIDGTQRKGTQIDLVIDRRDQIINLCEMKFSSSLFTIDTDYDERIRSRTETFRIVTKTRKALNTVMITTYGVERNKYSNNIQRIVTLKDLFEY